MNSEEYCLIGDVLSIDLFRDYSIAIDHISYITNDEVQIYHLSSVCIDAQDCH